MIRIVDDEKITACLLTAVRQKKQGKEQTETVYTYRLEATGENPLCNAICRHHGELHFPERLDAQDPQAAALPSLPCAKVSSLFVAPPEPWPGHLTLTLLRPLRTASIKGWAFFLDPRKPNVQSE
eukprot:scaffold774_cov248-Pinguiococcus_pyrenoidosus.AAC.16